MKVSELLGKLGLKLCTICKHDRAWKSNNQQQRHCWVICSPLTVFGHWMTASIWLPKWEQICHQRSRRVQKYINKRKARLAHLPVRRIIKQNSWANELLQSGKHINAERECPGPATMPVCPRGKRCSICQEMSCAEVQCALGFFLCNACQDDLQPLGEVNDCMVGGQTATAGEQVVCFTAADLSSSAFWKADYLLFIHFCFKVGSTAATRHWMRKENIYWPCTPGWTLPFSSSCGSSNYLHGL